MVDPITDELAETYGGKKHISAPYFLTAAHGAATVYPKQTAGTRPATRITQPGYGIRTEYIMAKTGVTFDSAGIPIAGHK